MDWKFNNDQFLLHKIIELKSLKKTELASKFDDLIRIIFHYKLSSEQKYDLINYFNKNLKLIYKTTNLIKIKILVLSNHYFEFFKNEIFLNGFYRDLFIELDFAEIDNFDIGGFHKKKKKSKDYYDFILFSHFPNYYYDFKAKDKNIYNHIIKRIKSFCDIKIILTNIPSLNSNLFNQNLINELNREIHKISKNYDCHLWKIDKLANRYGEDFIHDKEYYFDNKIFFNPQNSDYISDNLCSVLSQLSYTSPRAIVTDLDNTFWKGILGDDGIDKINFSTGSSLTEPHYIYQNFLKNLFNKGIIINISSKNDYDYVKKVFERRKFKIKFKDFTCKKINWDKKSENIYQISKELNLSLSNILFIDDNDSERFEVMRNLKKIKIINFKSANDLITNINDSNFFNTSVNNNKIDRSKSIEVLKITQKEKLNFDNYDDFLKELKMKCFEYPFDNKEAERLSEMTYKTNQFNFTFQRYNKNEINKICKSKNLAFYYRLKDKFVDHGIVASINIKINNDKSAILDSFVMSCRVFDKNLEGFIMNSIKKKLLSLKIKNLTTFFIKTDRNKRFYNFYENYNFITLKKTKEKIFYKIIVKKIKENKVYISK
jgi:FkbH-like protein